MRILVADERYAEEFDNFGEFALFDTMVRRLRQLWPESEIRISTAAPPAVLANWPGVQAVPRAWLHAWLEFYFQRFIGRLHRDLPAQLATRVARLEVAARTRWPGAARALINTKARLRHRTPGDAVRFDAILSRSDLVVVTGGGHFVRGHEGHAIRMLKVVSAARHLGIPVAMLSQGIPRVEAGPLRDWMHAVLPCVNLIALREGREAVPFLGSIGVPGDRLIVSGDDAIERAHAATPHRPGNAIGVNLRIASYSEIDDGLVALVRQPLHAAARRHDTTLLPVPISMNPAEYDPAAIRRLLAGLDDASDGGAGISGIDQAIARAGRCRLVVTGSYHAGVFALSQGVPVVGLARSDYYVHKFRGLADQFGAGCVAVELRGTSSARVLEEVIEMLWHGAERLRPHLLASARTQIQASHRAYDRLFSLAARDRATLVGQPA